MKWKIDNTHSQIQFKVKHLMITTVTGSFNEYESEIESNSNTFENAVVTFSANTNSINTGNIQRDEHLKSDDFFNSEEYPKITFVSTSIVKKDNQNWLLNGDLTIRNVTRSVSLPVEFGGTMTDPWGNVKVGFNVNGKINRKDYDLKWSLVTEAGGVVVSDDVKFEIEAQYTLLQNI